MKILLTGSEGFIGQNLQTFLKDKHQIICIDKNGDTLHFWHMVWRELVSQYLLALVTASIFAWLDYVWALWDKDRQTLHDKMAGTWVVKPLYN